MPTAADLRMANRLDIVRAIQHHGGFASLASQLGLVPVHRRLPRPCTPLPHPLLPGIRTSLATLSASGTILPDRMPTASVLRSLGRSDLVSDVSAAGGFRAVAQALNLQPARPRTICPLLQNGEQPVRRERHFWRSWRTLEVELRNFANFACNGHMPLQRHFIEAGRTDILNAIRLHGGMASVARRAGLTPPRGTLVRRPRGYWKEPSVLHAELATYTAHHGHPGLMPQREALLRAGRSDLVYAIERHGGFSSVAAELHLVWHGPSTFWRIFRNVEERLRVFIHRTGHPKDVMPDVKTLHAKGRLDLVYGIALHGGFMIVATAMGLRVEYKSRKDGFWEQPINVTRELEDVLRMQPLENRRVMPSSVTLVQIGRSDLASAIRDHGGWLYYAQRLGLRFSFEKRTQGFWRNEKNVVNELLRYVEDRYGRWEHPGKLLEPWEKGRAQSSGARYVPSLEMLKRDGRSDIAFAIVTFHGGMEVFTKKANVKIAEDVLEHHPVEELANWGRYVIALERWIDAHGSYGTMPTMQDLIRTGRHDLRYATYNHGGWKTVGKRLQLISAEGSVDRWLPGWLALQASLLMHVIDVREKERVSDHQRKLLRRWERVLNSSGVGKARSLEMKTDVKYVRGDPKSRAHRGRKHEMKISDNGTKRKSVRTRAAVTRLSKIELRKLRERYQHLPPDDLITV